MLFIALMGAPRGVTHLSRRIRFWGVQTHLIYESKNSWHHVRCWAGGSEGMNECVYSFFQYFTWNSVNLWLPLKKETGASDCLHTSRLILEWVFARLIPNSQVIVVLRQHVFQSENSFWKSQLFVWSGLACCLKRNPLLKHEVSHVLWFA